MDVAHPAMLGGTEGLEDRPRTMSVPIAIDGLKPKSKTRSGVISDPPPMPVKPTSSPIRSPASESFQSTSPPPGGPRPRDRRRVVLTIGEQDLLERVAAKAEAQRLERDDLVRRDVAQVDVRPECFTNHAWEDFVGASKITSSIGHAVRDLVEEARAHVAVGVVDPGGAALAPSSR